MIEKVISGGQTGADQAGWRAAKSAGIETGGYMPLDWWTEDGPRPDFMVEFGAAEWPELCLTLAEQYRERTKANVRDSDATIVFTNDQSSPGSRLTINACARHRKPCQVIGKPPFWVPAEDVVRWIGRHRIKVLNIAGGRESKQPGIGEWVEEYLGEVFRLAAAEAAPGAAGRRPHRGGRS